MGRIKNYLALSLFMAISFSCEKETIDLPVEDAKVSEDLTFLEFLNSGIDVKNYYNSIYAKEQRNFANYKSQTGLSSADEAYFDEFCSNLPVENFEEANIPDDNGSQFKGPLSESISHTNRIQLGDIESGLLITTDATAPVLAIFGDGYRDGSTKIIVGNTDQAMVLKFSNEDVVAVSFDVSSFPYPDVINTQEVTIEVLYASGEIFQETITASIDATFWGINGSENIEQIKVSSTNSDAWVGVDNIAFGTCIVPDSDVDGCADDVDGNDASNMEATIIIGTCDSGVANRMTSVCGITLADDVDSFEDGEYRNHGALVKEFASLTNLWVSQGIISSEEKGLLMSCAAKAGF